MKIIKKADVSGWNYKHTCTNCDSELEVDSKDLRFRRIDGDPREPGYDEFSATCIVCSAVFTIVSNKIPKLVQVEVKSRNNRISSAGTNYWDR